MSRDLLLGKVAIVSGAGSGIGRATALMMASHQARVVVNDVNNASAQETAKMINDGGGNAVSCSDSIARWDSAHKIAQCALDTFGELDSVVNCAGTFFSRPFHELSYEEWNSSIQLDIYGTFNLCRATVAQLRTQESGSYIHMVCTPELFDGGACAHHFASKMGIVGLSNSLTMELKRYNVRSNCIVPSAKTALTDRLAETGARGTRQPLPSPSSPAALATFLASDAAKDVQGQIFGARGDDLLVFSHPRPIRFLHRDGGWSPEALAKALPVFDGSYTPLPKAVPFD